jgi:hypothetical protein
MKDSRTVRGVVPLKSNLERLFTDVQPPIMGSYSQRIGLMTDTGKRTGKR